MSGTVTWEAIVGTPPLPASHPKPATDDLALIQYTSGTTGTPKGASLTHRNLLSNAAQARAWVPSIVRGDGCVVYAVLPMFHAYGLTLCLTFAMSMGARLVLFPRFDPDMVLAVTKKHPATFLPLVPPIADRLLKAAREKGVSLEGTQVAISGAMALPHELVVPFEAASGGYLVEGYGLSECSPVLMANPVADNRVPGTVGLPLPGTECRVVDPDDPTRDVRPASAASSSCADRRCSAGTTASPRRPRRSWSTAGSAPATSSRSTRRASSASSTASRSSSSRAASTSHRPRSRTRSASTRRSRTPRSSGCRASSSGEEVVAAIVVAPGVGQLDVEAIREFARGILTPYKVPRRIFVVDELPKSLIGKVLRRQVRDSLLHADDRHLTGRARRRRGQSRPARRARPPRRTGAASRS